MTYEADLQRSVLSTTLRRIVWPHCSHGNPLIVTISQPWLLAWFSQWVPSGPVQKWTKCSLNVTSGLLVSLKIFHFAEAGTSNLKQCDRSSKSSSTSSSIFTDEIMAIIEKLKRGTCRNSTWNKYYNMWKQFNTFIIALDKKPNNLEDRLILFVGHLANKKLQFGTIKIYVSANRTTLQEIRIPLHEDRFIQSLTNAIQYIHYRSGMVNLNTVNSKLHLIWSFCEIFARFLSFHV